MVNSSTNNENPSFNMLKDYLLPPELPSGLTTTFTVCYSVIMIGALLGNMLVIVVILSNKFMRTITNLFIVSLAVSDTFIAAWNMPLQLVYYLNNEWKMGEALCKFTSYFQTVNIVASIVTLVAVAIERYYAICHPLKARYVRTTKRAIFALISFWVFAFSISLPQLWIQRVGIRLALQLDKKPQLRIAYVCAEYFTDAIYDHVYTYIIFIMLYMIPMVVMFSAYGKIGHRLWLRQPIGDSKSTPQFVQRSLRQKRRIIKMLITVVITFCMCWLPFFAIQFYHLYHKVTYEYRIVIAMFQLLGYANSFFNPIIYGFMNENFKVSIRLMWKKCFKKQPQTTVSPLTATTESIV